MTSVDWINSLEKEQAEQEFLRCCGSRGWASQMAAHRPFAGPKELFETAEKLWPDLNRQDWLEAFSHHPRIGDLESLRAKFPTTQEWASGEQAGVRQASEETLTNLAEANRSYEEKFGYIFIVCASGKRADEMLTIVQERLKNDPVKELPIAAEEQEKITRIRLEKLLER